MTYPAKHVVPVFRWPGRAAARAMAAWALAMAALPLSFADPAHASNASPAEISIGKAYCQYLFSVPDREPDAFEAGYAQAIAHATARIIDANPSVSYFEALMRIRQACTRQMAAEVE